MGFWSSLFGGGGGARRIDGETARQLVAGGAALIDVRTEVEFAEGHAPGATNIPVAELAGRLDQVPRDRAIVVYCRSGARSARAARILAGAGIEEVHDMGPLSAWPR